MRYLKSKVPAAITAALILGFGGEASASVYAVSTTEVSNLSVLVTEDGTNPTSAATINSFTFTSSASGTLAPDSPNSTSATCGGYPVTCGASPVQDAALALSASSNFNPGQNNFTPEGASATNQYAAADTIIRTAELANGSPTNTEAIAQAEIQTATAAQANTNIQSTTNFTFDFTVSGTTGPAQLILTFDLASYMQVAIADVAGAVDSSQANFDFNSTLTGQGGAYSESLADCGTTNCTVNLKPFGIANATISTGTNNSPITYNRNGSFSFTFNNITDGDYSFGLSTNNSVNIRRNAPVPEPDMTLLMGIGLLTFVVYRARHRSSNFKLLV